MSDYLSRAMAAHFRECSKKGYIPMQPSQSGSGIEEYKGKQYVVLRNTNGIMKVYRITTSGQLKNLKRWPAEIKE
jgi:hypothetical protein